MEKDNENPISPTEPQNEQREKPVDASRRRLATAGLAAVVLMTVTNRSAMAGMGGGKYIKNCTYSAMVSAGSGPVGASCYGKDCNYWKTKYSSWPSPCIKTDYGYASGWGGTYTRWSYKSETDSTATFKSCFGSYPSGYQPKSYQSYRGGWGEEDSDPGPSLLEVLENNTNPKLNWALEQQCVAALLNAVDDTIPFGYTPKNIIDWYKSATTDFAKSDLLSILTALNEQR